MTINKKVEAKVEVKGDVPIPMAGDRI